MTCLFTFLKFLAIGAAAGASLTFILILLTANKNSDDYER